MSDFYLDTGNFDIVIIHAKTLAKEMATLRDEMDGLKNALMFSWAGSGRNTFEKKYRLFSQQFADLKDDLYEMAESLLEIQEKYIQADTNLAKGLEGQSSRY